jgi:hypothetical protein
MPVHTPGAINSSGNDDQGAQQTNLAKQYPNTVDTLAGMQYPDMGGGPDSNALRLPYQTAHPASTPAVNDPGFGAYYLNQSDPIVGTKKNPVPDFPQYGTSLNEGTTYAAHSEE